ncbi:predicted protein [Naegleria gruberi]|uniref:Predicted protein n=1 Tax=Naegleria gruberi TaxID=5762 RepID=D2VPW8_NAEGR|nr:uncharacterized protein NAEGRDRAFT_51326 [Naegleria gruberi]EFC41199.1 predicted protein [Naegleria gruberi]|eukprot:XP_002673943.1 predicted protein [Naegleria gruberi strain NEG-M]
MVRVEPSPSPLAGGYSSSPSYSPNMVEPVRSHHDHGSPYYTTGNGVGHGNGNAVFTQHQSNEEIIRKNDEIALIMFMFGLGFPLIWLLLAILTARNREKYGPKARKLVNSILLRIIEKKMHECVCYLDWNIASRELQDNFRLVSAKIVIKSALLANIQYYPQMVSQLFECYPHDEEEQDFRITQTKQLLKSDLDIIKQALKHHETTLKLIDLELASNLEIVSLSVHYHIHSIKHAPRIVRSNEKFMKELIAKYPQHGELLQFEINQETKIK